MLGSRAVELAAAAARDVGLSSEGAAIHRRLTSVHVELPAAGVMARVEPGDALAVAQRQVEVARFLATKAVRTARLVAPDRQPLIYPDGIVTLWKSVVIVERRPAPALLGRLARRLHEVSAGGIPDEIPDLDPFFPVRRLLDRLGPGMPPERIGKLRDELDRLTRSWQETIANDPLGTVVVHGDFHKDNVVVTPHGLTLLDLEDAGRGPASWDLVPHLVGARRYGTPPAECRSFCEGYGADPLTWDGTEVLCRVYEFHLTCWAVSLRHTSPEMAAEAEVRLSSFLGSTDRRWSLR